jgi:hypothetical protein
MSNVLTYFPTDYLATANFKKALFDILYSKLGYETMTPVDNKVCYSALDSENSQKRES